MIDQNLFIWNVRGLNSRARRDVVREFLARERTSVACLVETKLHVLTPNLGIDIMGTDLDYVCLPSEGASGGIVVSWRRSSWSATRHVCRSFSVTVDL